MEKITIQIDLVSETHDEEKLFQMLGSARRLLEDFARAYANQKDAPDVKKEIRRILNEKKLYIRIDETPLRSIKSQIPNSD